MKIAIIGSGNLASHLMKAFREANQETCHINSRSLQDFPTDCEVYFLAVSDKAVQEVSDRLSRVEGIIAHTAGSVDIEVLKAHKNRGVFYPLQTFSKGAELRYKEIPIFIEANSKEGLEVLRSAATLISDRVEEAENEKRRRIHLAAVFASNFSNLLFDVADSLMRDMDLNIDILYPLIEQTVEKLKIMSPFESQTGPAMRGDSEVIKSHENMLQSKPDYLKIYKILTAHIMRIHSDQENILSKLISDERNRL